MRSGSSVFKLNLMKALADENNDLTPIVRKLLWDVQIEYFPDSRVSQATGSAREFRVGCLL
jgi:hypothetical protein